MDCSVVAENMMLAGHSLGIGSCFIGGAVETFSSDFGQEILEKWDLPKGYKGYLHIVFGYPKTDNPSPKPRKEGRVKFL
ncbi:MAG: nitroreductase family protein [Lachnospirales bacterium]